MSPEEYYNQESAKYSHKRYEGVTDTYVKYFFRRRLSLVLKFLNIETSKYPNASLLEVGCADGVVLREIEKKWPDRFERLVGVDIAEDMLAQAREIFHGTSLEFYTKTQTPAEKFDIILLVGFMNRPLIESERTYIRDHLRIGGYIIMSLATRHSTHARLKVKDMPYFVDYASYQEYRTLLERDFEILATRPYGFFIPKLWVLPILARLLQPVLDLLLAPLFPELFHECLYLLRRKI